MKVTLFFRKPQPGFFSIEAVFDAVAEKFPGKLNIKKHFAPFTSSGIKKLYINGIEAKNNQGDVNHITGDIHYVALFLNKDKTILTIHDLVNLNIPSGPKKIIFKLLWYTLPAKRVRYITVISECTKKELLQKINVNPEIIKVIPDCVSSDFSFTPHSFNQDCPHILHIGTKANKNLANLIQALQGINCKLLILGKLKEEQKKMLHEHKVNYQNSFNISRQELVQLYQKSDIVSFISTYEGFGMPIVEAQAIGRPVITSNISSMPEVAGDSALLVDPYDVRDIRKGILKIINDESLRQSLIVKGQENIKRFLPERIAEMYQELYTSINESSKL